MTAPTKQTDELAYLATLIQTVLIATWPDGPPVDDYTRHIIVLVHDREGEVEPIAGTVQWREGRWAFDVKAEDQPNHVEPIHLSDDDHALVFRGTGEREFYVPGGPDDREYEYGSPPADSLIAATVFGPNTESLRRLLWDVVTKPGSTVEQLTTIVDEIRAKLAPAE